MDTSFFSPAKKILFSGKFLCDHIGNIDGKMTKKSFQRWKQVWNLGKYQKYSFKFLENSDLFVCFMVQRIPPEISTVNRCTFRYILLWKKWKEIHGLATRKLSFCDIDSQAKKAYFFTCQNKSWDHKSFLREDTSKIRKASFFSLLHFTACQTYRFLKKLKCAISLNYSMHLFKVICQF